MSKTGTPYAYVADNPLNAGDPSGMDGGPDILGAPFDGGTPGDGGGMGVGGLISYFVGAISAGFTQAVNLFCPLPPSFINGAAGGFNFELSWGGDNWFKAGMVVGVVLSVALLLTGPEDPLADARYAQLAERGGEKIAATGGGAIGRDLIFSGHGAFDAADGLVTIPKGTSLTFFSEHGVPISDKLGNAIETGNPGSLARYGETHLPGAQIPNYTLYPPDGLTIAGNPVTVGVPTRLSELLQEGLGHCTWAACR